MIQQEYYDVLGFADNQGESTEFVEFMLGMIRDALQEISKVQNEYDVVINVAKNVVINKDKVIFGFLVLLWKQYICSEGVFPLKRNMIIIGCIIGVIMLGIHEILHLLPYPKDANRCIAINQGK